MKTEQSTIVSPSILAADFLNLGKECEMLQNSEAEWIHVDVMDGVFVPNISFGSPVLKCVRKATTKVLDVHLMITDPQHYVGMFHDLGADILNVHYEACTHLHRTLQQIRDCGMRAAVTLNPSTPVNVLEDIIGDVDMVLLMSVNPGFGGQKFIEHTVKKIEKLRALANANGCKTLIEVDGGINLETGARCVRAGANVLVAGSFVFANADPMGAIRSLRELKA